MKCCRQAAPGRAGVKGLTTMALNAYKVWQYLTEQTGYDTFQEDVKENGYLCAECGERFHEYNSPILCAKCIENLVINYNIYQRHLYLHGVREQFCGVPTKDKTVAVMALFHEQKVIKIGATTNFYNWVGSAAKEYTFDHAAVLVVGDHSKKAEVKQLISLFAPEHNKNFKNHEVTDEVHALYGLMQKDMDRFLRAGLTDAGVKRMLLGSIPKAHREIVFNVFDHSCVVPGCDKPITKSNPLTIDHILPVSKGGTHDIENLQPMCRSHNSSKSNKDGVDYRPQWLAEHYPDEDE